ncbi:MAG: hypothetical protein GF330_07810 [Candidatus Eisenbacteria bacterium]|nr:hypothetical protein [Candidatus Eisenbacteria bacterium]
MRRIRDVDARSVDTFLRCLHDERPDDPRVVAMRRRWFEAHREHGLRAKVVVNARDEVVALGQAVPIEQSHLLGRDLLAILCVWVHGYAHHLGNRQGRGHGRAILEALEREARQAGFAGVAAWGMDFPYWNPVSFYEHMGYARSDQQGQAVLVWKRFRASAEPPRFRHQRQRPSGDPDKVSLHVFVHGWCMGACGQCVTARDAARGLEAIVDYREIDTSERAQLEAWGISDGVYLEGAPYRPCEPPVDSAQMRQDLVRVAAEKGLLGSEDAGRRPAGGHRGDAQTSAPPAPDDRVAKGEGE